MHPLIAEHEHEFKQVMDHLSTELSGLRTGRAHSSLVENLLVDVYGTMTPMKGVASISVPDARTILLAPWDPSAAKAIETAITNANLGLNPINEGASVRLVLPEMTEENRKAMAKVLGTKLEAARVSLRAVRDAIKDGILKAEKSKDITEDDRYLLLEKLDLMTKEYTKMIQDMGDKKEEEIMTI